MPLKQAHSNNAKFPEQREDPEASGSKRKLPAKAWGSWCWTSPAISSEVPRQLSNAFTILERMSNLDFYAPKPSTKCEDRIMILPHLKCISVLPLSFLCQKLREGVFFKWDSESVESPSENGGPVQKVVREQPQTNSEGMIPGNSLQGRKQLVQSGGGSRRDDWEKCENWEMT